MLTSNNIDDYLKILFCFINQMKLERKNVHFVAAVFQNEPIFEEHIVDFYVIFLIVKNQSLGCIKIDHLLK